MLALRPPYWLGWLLALVHLWAIATAGFMTIPWWFKLVLLVAIFTSAGHHLFRLTGRRRIRCLILKDDGHLEFSRVDGTGGEARISPQTTVTPLLVILLLCHSKRIEALVLLPDALSAEDFRLLRLWLRWCVAINDGVSA